MFDPNASTLAFEDDAPDTERSPTVLGDAQFPAPIYAGATHNLEVGADDLLGAEASYCMAADAPIDFDIDEPIPYVPTDLGPGWVTRYKAPVGVRPPGFTPHTNGLAHVDESLHEVLLTHAGES